MDTYRLSVGRGRVGESARLIPRGSVPSPTMALRLGIVGHRMEPLGVLEVQDAMCIVAESAGRVQRL
jgi:hypothetical protein